MKAPNNIWLSKFEEDPGDNEYGIFEQWSLEPISNAENEKYIRKDALLEWLGEKLKTARWYYEKMKHVTGSIGENNTWGKIEAYQEIINKINSL